jgi:phospholipid/cholesterol/gamma-HCH transport system substrate-binding protein
VLKNGGSMKKATLETGVGIFVLIGLICIGYLTIKLGKMELLGDNFHYYNARFFSVSGLRSGAIVEMAGVEIGQVNSISLDTDRFVADVELKVKKDVIASIKTAGLIGDKYIKLSPGGSDVYLNPGDTIIETESAMDIEELISKYVFGSIDD